MAPSHVAVVGGGLAGLSAGLELKRLGYSVDLFERRRLLGGKATSFEVDGIEVDNGQHVYLACCTEFVEFATAVGCQGAKGRPGIVEAPLVLQDRFEALLLSRDHAPTRLRSAPLPAPFHLLPALLNYRNLGIRGQLEVAMALLAAKRQPLPGESFQDWLIRHHQGSRSRTGFWEPFLVPALNAPLHQASAESALFVIRTAFLQDSSSARFGWSRVPLGRLAQAAAARMDNTYSRTSVARVEVCRSPSGASGPVTLVMTNGTRSQGYDGAVLAVPPRELKTLLVHPKEFGIFGLDEFRESAIVDVHLWYDMAPIGFGFAALLGSPVQWVFEKPAPPGEAYYSCSMSAADGLKQLKNQELVNLCHAELRAVLPALEGLEPIRSAATRDLDATFVPAVGLTRPGPATRFKQLVVAGAWTRTGWPATMESAVRSGKAAARILDQSHAA